jgi:hypothetical protein
MIDFLATFAVTFMLFCAGFALLAGGGAALFWLFCAVHEFLRDLED